MTFKSVLDIEVNDEQFKAFYELFQEYQNHLGSIPDDWRRIDQATKRAAKSFEAATAGTGALLADIAMHTKSMAEHLKAATTAQKHFQRETRGSAKELKKMAGEARSLGKHIFGIGKYLFKMGAIGGGLGLLGGFGLRELGESAVEGQRTARGMGLNQGQLHAWKTYFGPFVGPGIVQSVANAQTNPDDVVRLSLASGLSTSQVSGMKPDKLAYRIMMNERQQWKNTPRWQRTINPYIEAGLHFADQSDIRRWARTSGGTLRGEWSQYKAASAAWHIDAKDVTRWRTFTQEVSAAGHQIETVLTKRLAALAPPLSHLVKSLGTDGKKLIDDVLSPKNINAMSRAINEFTDYLSSKRFKSDFQAFETNLDKFFKAVRELAGGTETLAGWVFGKNREKPAPQHVTLMNSRVPFAGAATPNESAPHNNPGNIRSGPHSFRGYTSTNAGYRDMARLLETYPTKHHADTIRSIVQTYAPPSDHNDDRAYIANVSRWTGYAPNKRLNLSDPQVLARLMSAMVRQENGIRISPRAVRVVIENKAGSNVAVALNAAQ